MCPFVASQTFQMNLYLKKKIVNHSMQNDFFISHFLKIKKREDFHFTNFSLKIEIKSSNF